MVVGTKPGLAAVGSATVAVLSQSSGTAAIFCHEAGSRGIYTIIAPFTCCCTNSAVASTAAVREK